MCSHDLDNRGGRWEGDDTPRLSARSVRQPQIGTHPSELSRTDSFGGLRRGADADYRKGFGASEITCRLDGDPAFDRDLGGVALVLESTLRGESGLRRRPFVCLRHFGDPGHHRSLRSSSFARIELRRARRFCRVCVLRRSDECSWTQGHGHRCALDDSDHGRACSGITRCSRTRRSPSFSASWRAHRLVCAERGTFFLDDHCGRGSALHFGGFGHKALVARRNDSLRTVHGAWCCGIRRSRCDSIMSSRPSIAELKRGDTEAWAWFFTEFSGQIAGYARRMGVSDADDVTGTVLESVARSVGSFSGSHSQFRSWVFSIAHARIVDDHRRRDRRPEVEFTDSHDRTQAGADTLVVSGDPELEAAMSQLTEEQRSLLHLRFVLELSTKEIARVTDKSEVATRVALHRCSKRLRELLSGGELELAVEP